jgi:hypothetical protein
VMIARAGGAQPVFLRHPRQRQSPPKRRR